MKLNFKQYSTDGEPLLILHGLFGSLQNWAWHCKKLSENFSVYALDLRNHGASPHDDKMNYQLMANDVLEFMDDHRIESAHILGHSMGGKVAMQLALLAPERVKRLVIADVAPVHYGGERGEHDEIFEGLCALDTDSLSSRADADARLAQYVDDEVVRQFLLSNLVRADSGGFRWRINLPVLKASYPRLREAPVAEKPYEGEVLFVRGDLSDYILPQHRDEVLRLFPKAKVKTITQTGHWLHAEKPDTFYRIVSDFLREDT
ncbi:MAG: alpha/beta fold hydrolase [Pseudohongiella sp.]|nr:alpha/beta fold hydrolase [Pseudohongiella sp.]MDO9520413.1 alpha/beta fold hydrolase [Pseudohongiella sp.]MDP2126578.1 alpha/beta fold hydrolase [Pseudohongiella sp.]